MESPYRLVGDLHVLPSSQVAPGHGILPVNAYLFRDRAPMLVDTGLAADRQELLGSLWSLVDPADLRWVFLTHEDGDHAGNLPEILEAAPNARLVTNYLTVGKLLEGRSLPLSRVIVVNPGQSFSTSARHVAVVRPPLYDAPGTVGLWDAETRVVLTVDAFGTYLPALVGDLGDISEHEARAGLVDFNRANHPWVAMVDERKFHQALHDLRGLQPALVLSSHGVPARGRTALLLDAMTALPRLEPLVPPDQAQFETLKGEMGD